MGQPSDIDTLVKIVKKAWSQIDPDILTNLVADMPNRIKLVIERDGDYIDKWIIAYYEYNLKFHLFDITQ